MKKKFAYSYVLACVWLFYVGCVCVCVCVCVLMGTWGDGMAVIESTALSVLSETWVQRRAEDSGGLRVMWPDSTEAWSYVRAARGFSSVCALACVYVWGGKVILQTIFKRNVLRGWLQWHPRRLTLMRNWSSLEENIGLQSYIYHLAVNWPNWQNYSCWNRF